jgi:phospholipase/carboxylesterase
MLTKLKFFAIFFFMTSTPILLNGPVVLPKHTATHAVILLHGFGADGQDLINLADPLKTALSQFEETLSKSLLIAAPNAPAPTLYGGGRQWFSDAGWTFKDPNGQAQSHSLLNDYLTELETTHNIPRSHMVLVGFSQGGMQTLYSVPRFTNPVAGAVTIATRLNNPERPDPASIVPLLMLHGDADDVLPADETLTAAKTLTEWGFAPEVHILSGLPHGIDARCLAYIANFLTELWKN